MNAPIKLAQVSSNQGTSPVHVIKLVKPGDAEAVTVKTGYEGKVRIDFSGIADERISIVRVGETAVIYFHGNKSTITLDPFFGSDQWPLAHLEFELGPNRIFGAQDVAALLPFTVYQGILPAADGSTNGNEQDSGANFNPANVDNLPPILLNELMPPEVLPPVDFRADIGPAFDDRLPIQSGLSVGGIVEEEHLRERQAASPIQLSDGNEDTTSDPDADDNPDTLDGDDDTDTDFDVTRIDFTGNTANGQSLNKLISGGNPPFTFSFNNVTGQEVKNTFGVALYSQGDPIFFHKVDDNTLIGFADEDGNGTFDGAINDDGTYGDGPDRIVFVATLDQVEQGAWTIEIYDQFDHQPDGNVESILGLNLTPSLHAVDNDGDPLDFLGTVFSVGVIDDVPVLLHGKDIRSINEDDIETGDGNPTGSNGTSPQDGDFDGSFTNNPGDGTPGAAAIFGSLTNVVKVGADEHAATESNQSGLVFEFLEGAQLTNALATLNGLGLKSKGDALTFSIEGGDLVAKAGGRLVMQLVLQPDGDYSFFLHDQVDHDAPYDDFGDFPQLPGDDYDDADQNHDLQDGVNGDVVFIDFGSLIKASDYDDDFVILQNKLLIKITDDIPEVRDCDPIFVKVDEDDIVTTNDGIPGGSLGNHPEDGNADGSYTGDANVDNGGPATVTGSLTGPNGVVVSGADEPLTFTFAHGTVAKLLDIGLTSKGEKISYEIENGKIIAFVNDGGNIGQSYDPQDGDRLVFEFALDADSGDFAFKLYDQLDHDDPDGNDQSDENFDLETPGNDIWSIDFGRFINATDYDGDTVNLDDKLYIKIRDDVPELAGKECIKPGTEACGADKDDLLFELPSTGDIKIDISNIKSDADYNNTIGYYFADENGNPISGKILDVDASDGDTNEELHIQAGDVPPGAKLVGFFIIPDGADLNSLSIGDDITFQYQGGQWVAYHDGQPLVAAQGEVLYSDRRLNPDISPDGNNNDEDDFEKEGGAYDSNWEDKVDESDQDYNDVQFDAKVCVTPVVVATVDEDDIDTNQSIGTSPEDGSGPDGSTTGGPTDNGDNTGQREGPAFVQGSLTALVKPGADEHVTFRLIQNENAIRSYLEGLGLRSKGQLLSYDINLTTGVIIAFDQTGNNGAGFTSFDPGDGDREVFRLDLDSDGDWTFTLTDQLDHDAPYDDAGDVPGPGDTSTADQNLDLQDNVDGDVTHIDFGHIIEAVDYDHDAVTLEDRFLIQIRDDIPEAELKIEHDGKLIHDETPDDNQGPDDVDYNELPSGVQNAFNAVVNRGNDPDVGDDNGAIGYARDTSLISVDNDTEIGADEPGDVSMSLAIVNSNSGLFTTEGQPIMLFLENGLIVGRVNDQQGQAVFAIHIEDDGDISVAQWLSIRHDDINDHDESNDNGENSGDEQSNPADNQFPNPVQQTLEGKIKVVLTVEDEDGDVATDEAMIGHKIIFEDDGPKVFSNNKVQLEDDDLTPNGNDNTDSPGDDSAPQNASGTLGHSYGSDGPGTTGGIKLTGVDLPGGLGFTQVVSNGGLLLEIFQNGDKVLSVTLTDATSGDYTVVQHAPIDHPTQNGTGSDNTENNVEFKVKYRVTDGDGDYANGEMKIDVDDDMPKPTFTVFSGTIIHDETSGDDADADDTDTNLSALFPAATVIPGNDAHVNNALEPAIGYAQTSGPVIAVTPNVGADVPGTVTYSVDVAGASSINTGLFTTEGKQIWLFEVPGNSNLLVGRYEDDDNTAPEANDPAAFAIHVDPSTGVMTIVQYVSIKHDDFPTDHDEADDASDGNPSVIQSLPDSAVRVTVTVEDNDGDAVTKQENIGNQISFQDDGPTVTAVRGNGLLHDETPGVQSGAPDADAPADIHLEDDVADASAAFTAAGFVLPGTVIGYAQQANAVLLAVNYGADGPGSTTIGLTNAAGGNFTGQATNLFVTEGGRIFLYTDANGVVVGREGGLGIGDANPNGPIAFALVLDAGNTLSLAQFLAIDHFDPASNDEAIRLESSTGGDILFSTVTATDGDGDSASATTSLNVHFDDDGPKIISITKDTGYGPELITNGSFEQGHDLVGNNWEIFASITDWEDGADGLPFEIQTGGAGGVAAKDGNALVELDGDTEGNPGNPLPDINPTNNTNAIIQQTVHGTVDGQTYELTFWYHPRPNDGDDDSSSMNVLWNGAVVHSIDSTGLPDAWQQITVLVTATGDPSILGFQGAGQANELGALIDLVSLRSISSHILDDEDTTLSPAVEIQGGPGDDGNGVVASGKINYDAGTDGLKSIVIGGIAGLQAIWVDGDGVGHPESVSYHWVPDGLGGGTLYGLTTHFNTDANAAFKVSVDVDGNYVFTLIAPLNHPGQDDPSTSGTIETSFEDNLQLDFPVTITDGDDDTATGTLCINVDDDSPMAVDPVCEPTQPANDFPTWPQDISHIVLYFAQDAGDDAPAGGDGYYLVKIDNVPDPAPDDLDGWIEQALAWLIANDPNIDANSDLLGAVIKGGNVDGSTQFYAYGSHNSNGTAPDTIPAGAPPITTPPDQGHVDGPNIDTTYNFAQVFPNGIPTLANGDDCGCVTVDEGDIETFSGTVTPVEKTIDLSPLAIFGADGMHANGGFQIKALAPQAFGTIMVGGVQVQVQTVGGVLVGHIGNVNDPVFTLEIVDGDAVFSLYQELDHGALDELELDFGQYVYAVDGDGDAVPLGSLCIKVEDGDTPFFNAGNFLGIVEEEHLANFDSDFPGVSGSFNVEGSAGNEDTTSHDGTNTVEHDNNPATVDGDDDAPNTNTTNLTSGTLSVSGGDGALIFSLNVTSGDPVNFVEGGAQITSKGQPVHFIVGGGGLLWGVANGGGLPGVFDDATDRIVFTITLNPTTGLFTFDLNDQLDHHPSNAADNVEGIKTVDLGGVFKVDDSDAITTDAHVFTDVKVQVIDDTPISLQQLHQEFAVDEDELGLDAGDLSVGISDGDGFTDEISVGAFNLLSLFQVGADEEGTLALNAAVSGNVKDSGGNNITSNGAPVLWGYDSVNSVVFGYADVTTGGGFDGLDRVVFRIEISGGNFIFDLEDQIDHGVGNNDDDTVFLNLDASSALKFTDADGDSVVLHTNGLLIRVENDIPSLTLTTASTVIVHDESAGLQNAGVPVANVEDFDDNDVASVPPAIDTIFDGINASAPIGYAQGSGASFVTITPGADEPVTPSYTLDALISGPSGLTTTDGRTIHFHQLNPQTVVGYVNNNGDNLDGNFNETPAVAITVDALTGEIYVAQWLAIDNPTQAPDTGDASYDEAAWFNGGVVKLLINVEDADDDHPAQVEVDLGGVIRFEDDGPNLAFVSGSSLVSLDETTAVSPAGFPIVDTSDAPIVVYGGGFGTDGAAAGGGVSYAITVTDIVSGLQTADNWAITLVQTNATTITGQYNDGVLKDAFTVVINANGTLTVTQNVPLEHLVDGDNSLGEHNDTLNLAGKIAASVTLTDGDGDKAVESTDIGGLITLYDDGPSATNDGNIGSAPEGSVVFNLGSYTQLTNNDDPGADGFGGIEILIGSGSLGGTINISGGNLLYTPAAAVDVGPGGATETFTYKLFDNDGDFTTATFTVGITDTNTIPTAGITTAFVDDEGLANGILGNGSNSGNTDEDTGAPENTFLGNLPGNVFSETPAEFRFVDGAESVGGVNYTYDASPDGLSMSVKDGATEVMTVQITNGATGAYTVTLVQPIDHPSNHSEDNVVFNLTYTVKDNNNDVATGTLKVDVDDDTPTAVSRTAEVTEGGTTKSDVVLIIDRSGSMGPEGNGNGGSNPPGPYNSRLDMVKDAIESLFNSGAVNSVFIVHFGSDATHINGPVGGWYTDLTAALAAIDAIDDSGSTDYDAALDEVMDSYGPPPPGGERLVSLFLSDGLPNENNGTGSNGIDEDDDDVGGIGEETAWIDFLNGNDFDASYALGFGGLDNSSKAQLEPIAWNGTTETADNPYDADENDAGESGTLDPNVIIISDITDIGPLATALIEAVGASVAGDVIDNNTVTTADDSGYGADGPGYVSYLHVDTDGDGVVDGGENVYTFDGDGWRLNGGSETVADSVTFATPDSGEMTFNFATGEWEYSTPESVPSQYTENFNYKITDGDGDESAAADLDITVHPLPTLAVSTGAASEGAGHVQFTVSLSHGLSTGPIPVTFSTAAGTATGGGTDFGAPIQWFNGTTWVSTPFSFAPGQTSVQVRVPINNDTLDEADETFTLTAAAANGTSNPSANNTGTIQDDDAPVTLSIDTPAAVQEGVHTTITFTVTKSALSGLTSTVVYTVDPGTAGTPGDYTGTLTDTITFLPNETSKQITLTIVNDGFGGEPNENFTVTLSSPTNATIGVDTGTGTIIDAAPNAAPVLDINVDNTTNVRDEFGSNSYSINNGRALWTGAWIETGDDGSSSTGDIEIDGGVLHFDGSADHNDAIERAVDLSGAATATVTFSYNDQGLDSGENIIVRAWNGTTNSWQQIGSTILGANADGAGSFTGNLLAAHIGSHTKIQLLVDGSRSNGNDVITIDNFNIAYTFPSGHLTTYLENNAAGVPVTDLDTSITDSDVGDAIVVAKVKLTNAQAGDELFATGLPGGFSALIDTSIAGEITLTINGSGAFSAWQDAIESVRFRNNSENPATTDRVIHTWVNDGEDDSNVEVTTVNVVAVNDAPEANDITIISNFGGSSFTVPEWAFLVHASDPDGDPLDFTGVNDASGFTTLSYNSVTGLVTIDDNSTSGGTFDYEVTDGTATVEGSVTYQQDTSAPLSGTEGDDIVVGNTGNSTIDGNGGRDVMFGGGGADIFDFNSIADSGNTLDTADIIGDWSSNDTIDLSSIDANGGSAGDPAFGFGGENVNTVANSVTWYEDGGNTIVQVDTNGAAGAEMMFVLTGINHNLTNGDFNL